jgi:hypothetical protein
MIWESNMYSNMVLLIAHIKLNCILDTICNLKIVNTTDIALLQIYAPVCRTHWHLYH